MITIKEWMELVDYRITEGSDFFTSEKTLYSLSSWNERQDGYSFGIIFDTKDQSVYAVEACDYKNNRAYRLKISSYNNDSKQAWDDVNFIDLESDDDFLQKALAIKNGEDYDTRVVIPIDLPDDVCYTLMKMAHERDLTFNDFIGNVIEDYSMKTLAKIENDSMKKYKNRYGDTYYYEPAGDKVYKFIMEGKSMEWCRYGGRDGDESVSFNNLGMFDPSGGPYVSIGSVLPIGKVKHLYYSESDLMIEVE